MPLYGKKPPGIINLKVLSKKHEKAINGQYCETFCPSLGVKSAYCLVKITIKKRILTAGDESENKLIARTMFKMMNDLK